MRLAASGLVGLAVGLAVHLPPGAELIVGWNIAAFVYLVLTWWLILRSTPEQTRRWAAMQVAPRSRLVRHLLGRRSHLVLVAGASFMGLSAALTLLEQAHKEVVAQHVFYALGVVASWLVLHTSYTLYYAYLYYNRDGTEGGLAFPGGDAPDQGDFAYFAFTIGTTFAASDVAVTNWILRRTVLGHTILAFAYNAAILSVAVSFFTRR